MPAFPVIIDDGGSTRIRELTPNENMDELLDPGHLAYTNGRFTDPAPPHDAMCLLTIVHIEQVDPPAPPAMATQSAGIVISGGDTVQIDSENNQSVHITLNPTNKKLKIVLGPTNPGGAEPIAAARQHHDTRLYVVTNAGSINQVSVNGVLQFAATLNTIYTLVRLASA
jgi:hypothetical protein